MSSCDWVDVRKVFDFDLANGVYEITTRHQGWDNFPADIFGPFWVLCKFSGASCLGCNVENSNIIQIRGQDTPAGIEVTWKVHLSLHKPLTILLRSKLLTENSPSTEMLATIPIAGDNTFRRLDSLHISGSSTGSNTNTRALSEPGTRLGCLLPRPILFGSSSCPLISVRMIIYLFPCTLFHLFVSLNRMYERSKMRGPLFLSVWCLSQIMTHTTGMTTHPFAPPGGCSRALRAIPADPRTGSTTRSQRALLSVVLL